MAKKAQAFWDVAAKPLLEQTQPGCIVMVGSVALAAYQWQLKKCGSGS